MDISIIIVNYKSKEKTLKCIRAVKESALDGLSYEIIVVDNASFDESKDFICEKYPEVIFIQSKVNLGMGGGNNLGFFQAQGKFVLILNPDTYVERNTIKTLYEYIDEHADVGIVGPKLLYPDKTLQYTCHEFPNFFHPLLRRTFLGKFAKSTVNNYIMSYYDHKDLKEVDWLQGSCLMIRNLPHPNPIFINKNGREYLFDERFFMYFEDTDLCRRSWKVGNKVIYYPQAAAIHDHTRASAKDKWFIAPFTNKLARTHIASWIKYFLKWFNTNGHKFMTNSHK